MLSVTIVGEEHCVIELAEVNARIRGHVNDSFGAA